MCMGGRLFHQSLELFFLKPAHRCGKLVPNRERPVPNREPHHVGAFAVNVVLAEPRRLFGLIAFSLLLPRRQRQSRQEDMANMKHGQDMDGRNNMSRQDLDRILFDRIWDLGAQAVKDEHLSALAYATVTKPTLEEYQESHGPLQADLIKVIQLGILKLRERGELQEP